VTRGPRWSGVPRGIVVAVVAESLVLLYGGVVHLVQLGGGWPPYPWAPAWLAVYFTSLTVLDPVAALLLLARRQVGLHLAAFVLVTDAGANWYASYYLPRGPPASRVAHAVICGLAVGSLVIARRARPWMRQRHARGVV
jgi:hypothetical protein